MAGFGGALKNISIGIASAGGKSWIHSGGTSKTAWGGTQNAFLESQNGMLTISHAEALGLGTQQYELIMIE
jgi:uncharacterized Fe-S center protein